MSSNHGKNQEILGAEGLQDGGQCNADLCSEDRQHGGGTETEPIRVNRAMVEGDAVSRSKFSLTGGILSQLISQAEAQLADRRDDLERTNSGIQRLESYLSELKKLLMSNFDPEN
jgi:hypothetical protein